MIIAIQFYYQQEYIARTLCINRNKPEKLCSGKCVLNIMMKKSDQKEKQSSPVSQKDKSEFWVVSIPQIGFEENFINVLPPKKTSLFIYQTKEGLAYLNQIIHPPELV